MPSYATDWLGIETGQDENLNQTSSVVRPVWSPRVISDFFSVLVLSFVSNMITPVWSQALMAAALPASYNNIN